MSSFADLKASLDAIGPEVSAISAGVDAVLAKLAAIQTGGTLSPADQAAPDAAVTEATGIKTALDPINAALNPAP